MLGNFSFGDYFKKEAITWAWEYLLNCARLSEERLLVSVYEKDEEAFNIWHKVIGLPKEKIFRLGEADNFWGPAGRTGACGPCSEVYYDLGRECGCGKPTCAPGCDCDRFLEIYNLVFPQFDCQEDGQKLPLAYPGIDTGMGLERLAMVSQGKKSVFETDCLLPIIKRMEEILGLSRNSENKLAFDAAADHIRGVVFAIADGVLPAPEERGYVVRSLIRRALLFSYKILKIEEPFLYKLTSAVVDVYHTHYPEVKEVFQKASLVVKAEEERFLYNLSLGIKKWEEITRQIPKGGTVSGEDAFRLSDTYGLGIEIQEELAASEGLTIDKGSFLKLLDEQRQKSKKTFLLPSGVPQGLKEFTQEFVGYETLSVISELYHYEGDEVYLHPTPFYAEAGGQVGDTGWIEGEGFKLEVISSYYKFGFRVARVRPIEGKIQLGRVLCTVDKKRRCEIERAHTATHLLHKALKILLGEDVRQEGSLVEPGRLRFDFNFPRPLKEEEIKKLEAIVYEKILEDLLVEKFFNLPIEEARAMGAVALFTEQYGEKVQVIKIGDFSCELCGGTHTRRTGEIGYFRIRQETGVAAGTRRIEALCGARVKKEMDEEEAIISALQKEFGPRDKILKKISEIKERVIFLEKSKEKISQRLISNIAKELVAEEIKGVFLIFGYYPYLSLNDLRNLSDTTKKRPKTISVFLTDAPRGEKEKVFLIRVSPDLQDRIKAKELADRLGKTLGGGGGGRDDLAEGGLKGDEKQIKEAIIQAL